MPRNDPYGSVSTRRTSQVEQADPRQIQNSAGGFTFKVPPITRLRRFLTLGTDGGTYYTNERKLTKDAAQAVIAFAQNDPITLVNEIVDISTNGRAPRQQPAIFALAIAASLSDKDGRNAALAVMPKICRTGYSLFLFASYIEQFRGWGRGLRQAVANWYLDQPVSKVAFQALKYRQREGWTHRDLLRLAHPQTDDRIRNSLFKWMLGKDAEFTIAEGAPGQPLEQINGFRMAQSEQDPDVIAMLIARYGLSWEMLPDHALKSTVVWERLIKTGNLPLGALIRQLPRLTNLNLFHPTSESTQEVVRRLTDQDQLRRARIHPVNVLIALKTYASGSSPNPRSRMTWNPSRPIIDALDSAFYQAFKTVTPTGKRIRLALDVSGSMTYSVAGIPNLSCREASAAMALSIANVESTYDIVGFCSSGTPMGLGYGGSNLNRSDISGLSLSPRQRLDDAVKSIDNLPFGGTDCALPMVDALQNRIAFDAFIIYTDSETWAGKIHPHQALKTYNQKMGLNAKLVVVGMTATDFSIADPDDPNMLDVAGFDASVPTLISNFIGDTATEQDGSNTLL